MAFRRTFTPELDGGLVEIGDGDVRKQTLRIESGEYDLPIWLRTESGLVIPVAELPYRGVLEVGEIEVLSAEPGAGDATVIFHSDWTTDTGFGSDAKRDTDKDFPWTSGKGDAEDAVVVDTAQALGFPDGITHALEIWHIGGGSGCGVRLGTQQIEDGPLPDWEVGVKRFWRVYIKVVMPDEPNPWGFMGDGSSHPFQDGAGGSSTNWEFDIEFSAGDGFWVPQLELTNVSGEGEFGSRSYSIDSWPGDGLLKNEVYRIEFGLERGANDTFDLLGVRVFDDEGTLLHDEDDWIRRSDDQPASAVVFNEMGNPGWEKSQQLGINGFGQGTAPEPYVIWYWAAFAIGEGDWLGPYPIAGVED